MRRKVCAVALSLLVAVVVWVGVVGRSEGQGIITDTDGIGNFELYGESIVWWQQSICTGKFADEGTIRLRGHFAANTKNLARSCMILQGGSSNAVRDDAYVYFFSEGQLHRKALGASEADLSTPVPTAPFTPTLPAGEKSAYLELSEGWIYWSRYVQATDDFEIYRMKTDGSAAPAKVGGSTGGGRVRKMEFFRYEDTNSEDVDALLWLKENGVLVRRKLGIVAFGGVQLATGITDFAVQTTKVVRPPVSQTTRIYATKGFTESDIPPNPPSGTLLRIDAATAVTATIFTASGKNQLLSVATDSDRILPSDDQGSLYISEGTVGCGGELNICTVFSVSIWRHELPGAADNDWDLIVQAGSGGGNLRSDDYRLYFIKFSIVNMPREIWTIPTDVPPLEIDFKADWLEVVQNTQSLQNDFSLVANKPTFARGYAHLAKNTSNKTWYPQALLHGSRNGTKLPESPLSPINNGKVDSTKDLTTLRPALNRSFLFQLPLSWSQPGDLALSLTVNPEILPETGSMANNSLTHTVHFFKKTSPCLVFVPIFTTAPFYIPDSGLTGILARARSLLPVEDFKTYFQSEPVMKPVFKVEVVCTVIFPFYVCVPLPTFDNEAFDMCDDDDDDDDWALVWLSLRSAFSSDPEGCGKTHWVGTVHSSMGCFNGIGGVSGQFIPDIAPVFPIPFFPVPDNPVDTSLVVRMEPGPGPNPWDSPYGGRTFAHELGHNYGRYHVDQTASSLGCGGSTPDNPEDYPYDTCTFGPTDASDPATYFGFDPISQVVISPLAKTGSLTGIGDLMSYASSTWISKFTWDAIFGGVFPIGAALWQAEAPAGQAGGVEGEVLLVHGLIWPEDRTAHLGLFYLLPEGAADPDKVAQSMAAAAELPQGTPYLLRFTGEADVILAETRVVFTAGSDMDRPTLGFVQFMPYPDGARKIQLVEDGAQRHVLAERAVTAHAPTIELSLPVLDDLAQTLDLSWTAEDPDNEPLAFTLHYSANDGASWQTLLADFPWLGAKLNMRMLPGSTQARLRVIASDGVKTAMATTDRFSVARHAPEPQIHGVLEGQRLAFEAITALQGLGLDAEEGSLPGDGLNWTLEGPTSFAAAGQMLLLSNLSPGAYTAELSARDSDGQVGTALRSFEVLPVSVPEATSAPVLDGAPNDGSYEDAAFVRIPIGSDKFVRAWLLHSGGSLYACFTDLRYASGRSPRALSGIRVDVDASRDPRAQPGDIGFFVDEDGIPYQTVGNGSDMPFTLTPKEGFAAVIERGPEGWSAELRIDDSLVGGWDHAAGILLSHLGLITVGDDRTWPPGSVSNQPASWAPTYFGTAPPPPNRPPVADAGSDQTLNVGKERTVYLNGTGSFDPDGDTISFAWTQVVGPPVTMDDPGSATPAFLIQAVTENTMRRFRLVVSDGRLVSAPSETEVTILNTPRALPKVSSIFRRGDSNADGKVDISDAITTLGFLFLGNPLELACRDAADANDDGDVDVSDAILTLTFKFLGGVEIPAPGPDTCGIDPTADGLPICSYDPTKC